MEAATAAGCWAAREPDSRAVVAAVGSGWVGRVTVAFAVVGRVGSAVGWEAAVAEAVTAAAAGRAEGAESTWRLWI